MYEDTAVAIEKLFVSYVDDRFVGLVAANRQPQPEGGSSVMLYTLVEIVRAPDGAHGVLREIPLPTPLHDLRS